MSEIQHRNVVRMDINFGQLLCRRSWRLSTDIFRPLNSLLRKTAEIPRLQFHLSLSRVSGAE